MRDVRAMQSKHAFWQYRVRSKRDVFFVALVGALIASAASTGLTYLTLPADRAVEGALRALICGAVVSFPMIAVMAQKLRQNQNLSDDLQYLIDHDRLTDVATRDSFFRRLEQMQSLAGVVMMIDIDHFKRINDTHGHLVGDQVIRVVAQAIDQHTRESDVVARFGGEEFVAFVNCGDAERGAQVAERLRQTVAWHEVKAETGETVSPTVSIGVAALTSKTRLDKVIKAADDALYEAKKGGRNATCLANSGLVPQKPMQRLDSPARSAPRVLNG